MSRSPALTLPVSPGDGDLTGNMYEPDADLLAGESAEDEAEDGAMSPVPVGPPSPFTPKEGSPYAAPVYIPEDIPIPPDFELRESSVPGAGLGVWAKKKLDTGHRLGPLALAPRGTLRDADFGWEVSTGRVRREWPCGVREVPEMRRPCRSRPPVRGWGRPSLPGTSRPHQLSLARWGARGAWPRVKGSLMVVSRGPPGPSLARAVWPGAVLGEAGPTGPPL